jgi:broad specificity phosphatase PhoE
MDAGRSHRETAAAASDTTPPKPTCTLYLIRHGRTRLNAQGVLRGHLDVGLDEIGRREARALAETFRAVQLAVVVTSPLRRALATAERIAESTSAPLEIDEALIDRDYGPWAGEPRSKVEQRYGSLDRAPDMETAGSVVSRALFAAKKVAGRARSSSAAIVAHDAVNRALLTRLPTNTPTEPDAIPQRTGCWNRLDYQNGAWRANVIDAIPGDGTTP